MGNILGDTKVTGELTFDDTATVTNFPATALTNASIASNADIARTKLAQETLVLYPVHLHEWRVFDALASFLPTTPALDNLGLIPGTFATDAPKITAGNCGSASSVTRRMRALASLPAEYDDAETCNFRIRSAMETAVADVLTTVDVEAYPWDEDGTLNGSPTDLCTTAATSMNSLTVANYDFTLTPTSLVSASILDIRVTINCDDSATGTVTPAIYKTSIICDIRG